MQRVLQKNLSCKRPYNSEPVSGGTAEDVAENVMCLFCNRTNRRDSYGVRHDGASMRSTIEVKILRGCPKLSGVPSTRESIAKFEDNEADMVNDNRPPGAIHVKNEWKHTTKRVKFKNLSKKFMV